jgi:hypothetical protein
MPFSADEFADSIIGDVAPDLDDFSDEFVADDERDGDGGLRPIVPLVDMEVGSADSSKRYANFYVINADFRLRNFLQPEPGLTPAFH